MMKKRKIKWAGRNVFGLLRDTTETWTRNDPWTLSAAISYYSIISLPALLLIIFKTAGYFYGEEAIHGEITSQIEDFVGTQAAYQVSQMIMKAQFSTNTVWATVVGIGALIFSATAVFMQLQRALNHIWGIRVQPQKAILKLLISRAFSLLMIFLLGMIMIATLILSSLIYVLSDFLMEYFQTVGKVIFFTIDIAFSVLILGLLFTAILKVLPDGNVRWRDLWIGALITSVLFNLGKFVIGYYIGQSNPGSAYGAAGSVILILIWVAYSSLVFLFGAAFTKEYADGFGKTVTAASYAERTVRISRHRWEEHFEEDEE